jgi:hypothetical protein
MRTRSSARRISERLLWAKTKSGEIPHRRVGTRVIYPVALLQKWLVEEDEGGKS